jgi:undecaprenyl-diphosphatase
MSFFQSIILGALQGLAEFLPISSSGHLLVLKHLFGLGSVPLLFDILLHVATLAVVIVAFRKTIGRLFAALFRFLAGKKIEGDRDDLKLILVILAATVCTGALGYGISKLDIESPRLVSGFFIVTGLILIVPTVLKGKQAKPGRGEPSLIQGLIVGLAQGIGALPGISRSGITISAAQACGIGREKAGEFSFILSIPAILGALVLDLKDSGELLTSVSLPVLGAGMLTAAVVGAAALFLLLKLVRQGRLYLFSIYLIPVGILGILFF